MHTTIITTPSSLLMPTFYLVVFQGRTLSVPSQVQGQVPNQNTCTMAPICCRTMVVTFHGRALVPSPRQSPALLLYPPPSFPIVDQVRACCLLSTPSRSLSPSLLLWYPPSFLTVDQRSDGCVQWLPICGLSYVLPKSLPLLLIQERARQVPWIAICYGRRACTPPSWLAQQPIWKEPHQPMLFTPM